MSTSFPVASSSSARPREGIAISRRTEADRDALERMYREVFGERAAEENAARWRWQYEENPNCTAEGPEIWVAKENGEILGQYATMPVRLKVKDRTLRASWGMDVMVRPNLQRKGVGSRLFLYWDKNVEASLGLGLSISSYTLFRKLSWEDVGPVSCYSCILDVKALLSRRLGTAIGSALGPLASFFLWLIFPMRRTRHPVPVSLLSGPFGSEYDDLWDRVSPAFDFIAERSATYLQWKYRKVPHVSYEVFEAHRDGELSGYVVLRATERNGVRIALLVDLLVDPDDRESLGSLLDRALDWAREQGAARMQTFTFDRRIAARLASKRFLPISSPMQFCLRIHSDHIDDTFFRDTSRWHVTFGDSDQDREP